MRKLGVLASGEQPGATEATDGLAALNRMIDSFSNEQLLIPSKTRDVFSTVGGQQAYTLGSGGNWNTARPQKIENASVQIPQSGGGPTPLELPMHLLSKEEYAGVLLKTLTSPIPLYLYSDGAYPNTNVSLWPVPVDATTSIVLYSWKPLANFSQLTSTFSFPPGYEDMLIHNLAVRLGPEYGREPSPSLVALSAETKAACKRMNVKPRYLRVDEALLGRPAVWNWRTGDPQ